MKKPLKGSPILPGEVFTELTAVKRLPKDAGHPTRWLCRCSCGKTTIVPSGGLRNGNTRSCGCKAAFWRSYKHGMSKTKIYQLWANLHNRCSNPADPNFHHYGGRGITVCARWDDFRNFYADMGERPEGKSLERGDNDGPYSPKNCTWETQQTQCNNTRVNHKITFRGETLTVTQWGRKLGIGKTAIAWRLKNGWSVEKACTTRSLR